MYVVKTTDALVLFFKQRNLKKERERGKLKTKGREIVSSQKKGSKNLLHLCTEAM